LFGLFVLLNAVLFIRPAELVPDLMDLPIYEVLILLCLLLAVPLVARRVSADSLVRMPLTLGVVLVWVSIILSYLSHFEIYGARTEGTGIAAPAAAAHHEDHPADADESDRQPDDDPKLLLILRELVDVDLHDAILCRFVSAPPAFIT
jgi:hypothetical protein